MNNLFISISMALAFVANAHASMITVEPDSFAVGADISNATAGVILQLEAGKPVYAFDTADANYASTGTKVFGYVAGYGIEPYWNNNDIFRASFSALTDYVAIDVINNDGRGTDSATMQVFGTGDSLLTTIDSSAIGFPGHQTLSFKSGSANISYIRLTSANGSDFNLDYLQFSNQISVPAPESGSLALIGFGLLVYFSRQGRQGNPA